MIEMITDLIQVGPEEGQYVLTVEGFNNTISTLGDSFNKPGDTHGKHNGMKFSAK